MKAWLITAACLLGLVASPASSAPITWSFSNLVYDDGGTVSGHFVWESDTDTVTSWAIVSSEEVGNANFPEFTYSNTIVGHTAVKAFGTQTELRMLEFLSPVAAHPTGAPRARFFRLGIGFGGFEAYDVLDTPSGSLALADDNFKADFGAGIFPFAPGGFVECLNCSPFRLGTSDGSPSLTPGSVSSVPLPATLPLAMLALAVFGVFGLRRHRR